MQRLITASYNRSQSQVFPMSANHNTFRDTDQRCHGAAAEERAPWPDDAFGLQVFAHQQGTQAGRESENLRINCRWWRYFAL